MENQKEKPIQFLNRASPWGSQDDDCNDETVVAIKSGKRCCVCGRVVLNRHLRHKERKPYCPDCFFKIA